MKARTYRKHVANKRKEEAEAALAPATTRPAEAVPASAPAAGTTPAGRVVAAIVTELPGLLAVAVVEAESGEALAAHSNAAGLNPATAAAYNAQVIRQKQKAMAALHLAQERLEDILITLTSQLHLLVLNADGSRFIYLVVSARDSNLGIAREVLRSHVHRLDYA